MCPFPRAGVSQAPGCEGVISSVGTNANLPSLTDTHLGLKQQLSSPERWFSFPRLNRRISQL